MQFLTFPASWLPHSVDYCKRLKSNEIRNTKFETNPKFKTPKKTDVLFEPLGNSDLGFRRGFEFRIFQLSRLNP